MAKHKKRKHIKAKASKPLRKALRKERPASQRKKLPKRKATVHKLATLMRQQKAKPQRKKLPKRRATVHKLAMLKPVKSPPAKPQVITLIFPAEDLHQVAIALLPCMSMDENRPYLHGIAFDNDPDDAQGFRFVATDGHRLGIYKRKHSPIGKKLPSCSGIMGRDAVSYFASIKPKHYSFFKLEITGMDMVVHAIGATEETRRFKLIDGNLPDWERCLPIHTDSPRHSFRARYLADIAKAVHVSGSKGKYSYPSIALSPNSDASMGPAWLLTDIEGLSYVLMPQTAGDDMQPAPTIEERPPLQQLQALGTLLWQIKLTQHPELYSLQREIDDILSRMIDALKKPSA